MEHLTKMEKQIDHAKFPAIEKAMALMKARLKPQIDETIPTRNKSPTKENERKLFSKLDCIKIAVLANRSTNVQLSTTKSVRKTIALTKIQSKAQEETRCLILLKRTVFRNWIEYTIQSKRFERRLCQSSAITCSEALYSRLSLWGDNFDENCMKKHGKVKFADLVFSWNRKKLIFRQWQNFCLQQKLAIRFIHD